ncbi:MAG: hypothetical protein DRO39_05070 [Thermoprotei archaeon]|nr:MAG: hypothetical protein DRO39_05070 [Thermoprotei archaeon]
MEHGEELLIALLKPYAGRGCIESIEERLRGLSVGYELLGVYGKRVLIAIRGSLRSEDPCAALRGVRCVSRAVRVHYSETPSSWDLDTVCSTCVELGRDLVLKEGLGHVDVRRWDKSKPFTSAELGLCVARRLGLKLAGGGAAKALFVGVDKDELFVGVVYRCAPLPPRGLLEGVVAVVEPISTVYEMLDLVQLSRALGVELRLLGGDSVRSLLRRALSALGLEERAGLRVRVADSVIEALSGVDAYVVLTPYGDSDESVLASIASEYPRLALVLGSETRDVSEEFRRGALAEVRLGPPSSKPMRTSTALAYALGVIALARLSHG